MRTLSLDRLPGPLLEAARTVSARLLEHGYETWIVGGAVRDLLLNLSPKDVDIATNAHPDEVERLFDKTTAVGKAFGTIVVHQTREQLTPDAQRALGTATGVDLEVTTYRADGDYLDGRRPDRVTYAATLEEDAARRDFTCNALFASALTGELRDPFGGEKDLAQGVLRCVGVARDRFTEDGLRLMRLARFEGRFGLEPAPETLEGARRAVESLRGVSPERVRGELEGMFRSGDPRRALARMADLGLFERIFEELVESPGSAPAWPKRAQLFAGGGGLPPHVGLALLLGPTSDGGIETRESRRHSEQVLEWLRPSKLTQRAVQGLWNAFAVLDGLVVDEEPKASQCYPLLANENWPEVVECTQRLAGALGDDTDATARYDLAQRLEGRRAHLGPGDISPAPWLSSADLAASGIKRGPRWGDLLRESFALQLDGELADREAALAWLAHPARRSES